MTSLSKHAARAVVLLTVGLFAGTAAYADGGYARGGFHRFHHDYYRGYDRHDHGGDALAGLVIGMLLGSALSQSYSRPYTAYAPPAYAYPPPPVPPPVRYAPAPAANAGTCLEVREYWTTVTIGGRRVQAYGPACLQPDGSWRRGPARLANY